MQYFLGDEINRTSAKTQSALLEAMEERQVTVDGVTHRLPNPHIVIATQNPIGYAGTQPLPESQLDRFMMRLSIGYPDLKHEVEILKQTEGVRPVDLIRAAVSAEDVLEMQSQAEKVHVADEIYRYIAELCAATRECELLRVGASPRAGSALVRACKASAWISGRDYVVPGDVQLLFYDVMEHRVLSAAKAGISGMDVHGILHDIFKKVSAPALIK